MDEYAFLIELNSNLGFSLQAMLLRAISKTFHLRSPSL